MTKIFLDTEFTGLHQNTTLISIGLISQFGDTFYAEFTDFEESECDKWITDNVLDNLKFYKHHGQPNEVIEDTIDNVAIIGDTAFVKKHLLEYFATFQSKLEIWSDCLAYDWVLFNNIFGTAFDIPKNVYYIPFDICTLFKIKGIDPDISREDFAQLEGEPQKHNALWDAKVIKKCYEKLTEEKLTKLENR